ncbi:RNA polymerase sigma factor [Aquimarina hainanensis]|uniref:RNA polymerase sigma factor n=1 Tax=Aquimarina hainanensis TaxID=1578017 RepID=A0ABW5N697_9FLAO|nr:RNA polymerase sigma-70 factor [Aquimarina sp. TRL1]QKX05108.1 RNA polymerase sigma-70 factor [Aquimarina sp. TRL1]
MSNSDVLLLERLSQNDASAMTELYNRYWKLLYSSSYNVLRNKALCEDITQEVFVDVWNNRKKIEITTSLKSYLYACTRYKVFAQLKKNNKYIHLPYINKLDNRSLNVSTDSALLHKELSEQINTIIESLPEKCRNVFRLSRVEQMSYKEISHKLNISTKTVENHISKALQIIRASKKNTWYSTITLWLLHQTF